MKTPGSKLFEIVYDTIVTKKDIPALPHSIKPLIKEAIEYRLMNDPISFGKPLRFSLKGLRRIRVADYRIIYELNANNKTVRIIAIKHRKAVYDE